MANPMVELYEKQRQSPWLDFIRRNMLHDGGLAALRRRRTASAASPPTRRSSRRRSAPATTTTRRSPTSCARASRRASCSSSIAIADIRHAADILRPVFDASGGADGFVSIEVSPDKAFETQATIDEAKRWWSMIDRPNLMVKIPATDEGVPAIEECLAAGVNINITLIFALEFYERVMEAYLRGARAPRRGGPRRRRHRTPSPASSSAASTRPPTSCIEAKIAGANDDAERAKLQGAARQGRRRQREDRLRALPRRLRQRALQEARRRRARRCSGRCGRAPARRTRRTATSSTSRS